MSCRILYATSPYSRSQVKPQICSLQSARLRLQLHPATLNLQDPLHLLVELLWQDAPVEEPPEDLPDREAAVNLNGRLNPRLQQDR